MYNYSYHLFTDLICIEKNLKSLKNIFLEVNRIYSKHTNAIKECLFSNFQIEKFENKTLVSMTLTLLPHQILVLPAEYEEQIVNKESIEGMVLYNNDETIR
jgi:hypothetical protein